MTNRRIAMHLLQELVRLHRMNIKARQIARMLQISPNTERKYRKILLLTGKLRGDPDKLPTAEELKKIVNEQYPTALAFKQVSSITQWKPEITEMLEQAAGPTAIYDALRLKHKHFNGSLSAVKRIVNSLRRERGVSPEDIVIPVVTGPGLIGQVDFGYVGKFYDPTSQRERKGWLFLMVLGYSRHMFAQIVFDQKTETWLQLHINAFSTFGGVPKTIVPDNLKSAVVHRAFSVDGETVLNRSYVELARYYGFKIDPAPVRAPEKKGKVESGIKYAKNNFFKPRKFKDINSANEELEQWVSEIAGKRKHGTTGQKPLELFDKYEKQKLLPLPEKAFENSVWHVGTVHRDSAVHFDGRRYTVPWRFAGKKVWIHATQRVITIYYDDKRLSAHSRKGKDSYSIIEGHLPEYRRDYRQRDPDYWIERASSIAPEVGQHIRDIFGSEQALSKLRVVQPIVIYLEKITPQRAVNTCKRASFFGNYTYRGIKNIVEKGLDSEPLPLIVSTDNDADPPRYARTIEEMIQLPLEVKDESD